MATPKTETVTDLVQQVSTGIAANTATPAPVAESKDLAVTDDVTFTRVGLIVQECATQIGVIESRWDKVKRAAFTLHKNVVAAEKTELAPFEQVKATGTANMLAYRRAQELQRLEREREAQRAADNERLRLLQAERAKEQERLRLENEAKEARRQGDMRRAKEVTAQVAAVNQQIAQVQEEAAAVTEEVVHAPAAKVEGVGERRPWSGECYDALLTIKAVADGKIALFHLVPQRGGADSMEPLLIVNQKVLDHYAKRMQDSLSIPGVRSVQGFGLSVSKK